MGDKFSALRRWIAGERWVKRLAVVVAALAVIFAGCFFGLWWRLGAGPINLDMATPWLAAAIEENIGHGNTVEVGGTQIERAGRIRIAVRIRDIVVRDHDRPGPLRGAVDQQREDVPKPRHGPATAATSPAIVSASMLIVP